MAAKPGLTAAAMSPDDDLIYVANPKYAPELLDFQRWGLDVLNPDKPDPGFPYWENLSWENADKYQPDLILFDGRSYTPTINEETGKKQPTWYAIRAAKDGAWSAGRRSGCTPTATSPPSSSGWPRRSRRPTRTSATDQIPELVDSIDAPQSPSARAGPPGGPVLRRAPRAGVASSSPPSSASRWVRGPSVWPRSCGRWPTRAEARSMTP